MPIQKRIEFASPNAYIISSTTGAVSRKPRLWPPWASGIVMPMNPASCNAWRLPHG